MYLSDLEIGKGRVQRDRVWRQHAEMRTNLFKEYENPSNSHFMRPLIYDGKGHVQIVSYTVGDSASLLLRAGSGAPPATSI